MTRKEAFLELEQIEKDLETSIFSCMSLDDIISRTETANIWKYPENTVSWPKVKEGIEAHENDRHIR